MHLPLKRFLNIGGSLLAIAAIFFMAARLQSYLDRIDFSALLSTLWASIVALSCFAGLCNFFLVVIWIRCLEYLGVATSSSRATWIYGISQLGKYIPGNIFHLAGRQTLGMAENLPGGKVLRSMIWELAILAGAAAGVFCPPFAAQYFFSSLSPLWLSGIFAFCCIAVPYGVGRVLGKPLRAAYLWSILYLCCMGSVFSVILSLLTEAAVPHTELFFAGTAYVAAWFLGLVTPGAPAGLGIREGAMLFLMKGMPIPEADLLLAVLLGRIITIFGDFLFFLESVGIKYASGRKKKACL